MDKRFLNKVIDQIVSETMVNHETERIKAPFRHLSYSFTLHFQLSSFSARKTSVLLSSFSRHCKEIYGLDKDEVGYVWDKYIQIFRDKINNGL